MALIFSNLPKNGKNGQVLKKLANWPMEKVTGQMVFQLARFELFGHKLAHLATLDLSVVFGCLP